MKSLIQKYCEQYAKENGQSCFKLVEGISPAVDTKSCFDDLRVPPSHVSRKPSDTYYINEQTVLEFWRI